MDERSMNSYHSVCDDFYVNMNLNTEMELPRSREGVLHYFEQIRKRYPTMRHFYSRERGEFMLEEEKTAGSYRWTTVEPRRVLAGQVNPASPSDALELHRLALDLAPHTLSLSTLDCESLNLIFGFDYIYRGNHNQLIAEALGLPPAYEKFAERDETTLVGYEPSFQFTCDENSRLVGRVSFETRTTLQHIRSGEYPEEQFSVYLTGRRYGSLDAGETFVSAYDQLVQFCERLLDEFVLENVLRPVQQAIVIK
jgi:hypothetical protein